ncbi:MAG: immune inhibitor A [Anaerolineales bacterium]|nr:immune inhibitor A [Anaerolineales bacterium]
MENESRSGLIWGAVALLITLFCCLSLLVTAGAGSLLFLQVRSSETAIPVTQVTEEATDPVSPPTEESLIPPEAEQSLILLRETRVPIADPIDLVERLTGAEDVPRILAEDAEPVEVGTTQTFWASNVDQNTNFQVEAELAYATDHVYFWAEQGVDYDLDDVQALVDEFENDIYPTNRAFFGSEWSPGVDGDPHLYILFARGLGSSIAGYFASNQSYPPAVHEFSNGHEMFYLSADNLNLRDEFTYGVLAHEFQHMIHWNQDRNEETWMNEGFSELATLLNDYDVGGFDFAYARRPDQLLSYWPSEPGTSAGHYGQAFLFMSYFLQRFGSEATQALVSNPENGLDSIDGALNELGEVDEQTGAVLTADDVYRDFATALLLQDPSLAEGRYAITAYNNPPRVSATDEFLNCPLEPTRRDVLPYGLDYIRIRCDSPHQVVFDGSNLSQVVPADPRSGDYAFWSNRGDESDMTLTRSFDLSGIEDNVSLDYWVWYDIEEGWDYLYVEASADGGDNWEILRTPSGTDEDPSGNSYGWAYTAKSGGGDEARWIEESVDLSDYVGGEVLVRFEYVTDAAVNGEGLLLDDVRLDAIDYEEGFEQGEGGWEAAGFVRLFNRIPQSYRVVLVQRGSSIEVADLALDANRDGEVMIDFGGEVDDAFLIIMSTTRHTWQAAPYEIQVVR